MQPIGDFAFFIALAVMIIPVNCVLGMWAWLKGDDIGQDDDPLALT
jgi:hypothetical protein